MRLELANLTESQEKMESSCSVNGVCQNNKGALEKIHWEPQTCLDCELLSTHLLNGCSHGSWVRKGQCSLPKHFSPGSSVYFHSMVPKLVRPKDSFEQGSGRSAT